MVLKFKEFINESVWGDIHKRSSGTQVRKEDDVNRLDIEELEQYIYDHYEFVEGYDKEFRDMISGDSTHTLISIPVMIIDENPGNAYVFLDYRQNYWDPTIEPLLEISKFIKDTHILELIKKEYNYTEPNNRWDYLIRPKEGKTDNQFLIDVLDFILSHTEQPYEKNIIRKKDI